jgi:hypothetical protein
MNKREQDFEDWLDKCMYNLEDEFIQTLPPEDQPKTDDPDETEEVLMSHEEEFINYCLEEYDRGFNNE